MKKNILFIFLLIAIFFTGCSTTRIISSWKANDVSASVNFKKILVVGLINDKDRRIREHMESHLVGDLIDLGYDAVSSIEEYGPQSFQRISEDSLLKKLHNSKIDAVITISLLDKAKEKSFTPGSITYQPIFLGYNRFFGYYQTYYDRIYTPGYYTIDTKYYFETNLYNLNGNDKDLLYFAQSEAFDPANVNDMAHNYGRMIVKDLQKKSVVSKK
jgi:hypothetical protein